MTYEDVAIFNLFGIRPDLPRDVLKKLCVQAIGQHEEAKECHEYVCKCVQVISDFVINAGSIAMAEWRAKHGNRVFNFMFNYYRKGSMGMAGTMMSFEAATHCMELPYFFGVSLFGGFKVEEEDHDIVDRFTTYLTTFIKTG